MRVLWFALVVLVASTVIVQANSTGPPSSTVVSGDGCTCHGGGSASSATVVTVAAPAAYLGATSHAIRITSTTDVVQNPAGNKGGFLAWVSHGSFAKRQGSEDWYIVETVDGKSVIKHNLNGDQQNAAQDWRFNWIPPTTDVGPVTLKVWVNRVNGDNNPNEFDHWNRKHTTIAAEPHGDPAPTTPTSTSRSATTVATGTGTRTTGPGTSAPTTATDPSPSAVAAILVVVAVAFLAYRRR